MILPYAISLVTCVVLLGAAFTSSTPNRATVTPGQSGKLPV
jgi:hypothetical protein